MDNGFMFHSMPNYLQERNMKLNFNLNDRVYVLKIRNQ